MTRFAVINNAAYICVFVVTDSLPCNAMPTATFEVADPCGTSPPDASLMIDRHACGSGVQPHHTFTTPPSSTFPTLPTVSFLAFLTPVYNHACASPTTLKMYFCWQSYSSNPALVPRLIDAACCLLGTSTTRSNAHTSTTSFRTRDSTTLR
jgi:hypothetical protein